MKRILNIKIKKNNNCITIIEPCKHNLLRKNHYEKSMKKIEDNNILNNNSKRENNHYNELKNINVNCKKK